MSNQHFTDSGTVVPKIYTEPYSNADTMQRRYWRQSNEAEAANHPYIVIRPATKYARVVCDWITARENGRSPQG